MAALLLATSHATIPDLITFVVGAALILIGALGVITARNPVHAALMLVMTLFGVALLFIEQQAEFLAVVQVIVYAGAIVVLFLFVIMFLGVDRQENIDAEPLRGQRPIALVLVVLAAASIIVLGANAHWATGAHHVAGIRGTPATNVARLGRSVFTTYLLAFEMTAGLLVIAVVGAVVLARRHHDDEEEAEDEPVEATAGGPAAGEATAGGPAAGGPAAGGPGSTRHQEVSR